jgi:hydroxymethylglutaryl-CoA lyase
MKFARPGLKERKEKLGEDSGQKLPKEWSPEADLPERYRAS